MLNSFAAIVREECALSGISTNKPKINYYEPASGSRAGYAMVTRKTFNGIFND